jgi:SAM-dependent MidA family methyltransferase
MFDNRLSLVLTEALKEKPYLNFAEYMSIALYHPNGGYYMQTPSPIGRDFVTAPLISPLLAKAISRWFGKNQIDSVVEIGAGSGILAKQILEMNPGLNYAILEKNIKGVHEVSSGLYKVVEHANDHNGAVIANEVLDALPFRRFCYQEGKFEEFVITQELKVALVACQDVPSYIVDGLVDIKGPYVFEHCDYRVFFDLIRSVKGPVLLIDYGYQQDYFHPDRALGGMMCYEKHKVVPFSMNRTGLMDITHAVDWTEVESVAKECGFEMNKFGPQSDFIFSLVDDRDIDKQSLSLLCEHEMGTFVKVMSLSSVL